ncbi:MAG: hypothetical protein HY352_03145 [Candidatus Omnitrophica bacterium]|nr:hypothetical protein [Candidatus Omnitrophota bacterium]
MSPESTLERVGTIFADLASLIEARKPADLIQRALADLTTVCAQASAQKQAGAAQELLRNVSTAVQTWEQVWPRLGQQPEFRLAVAREARMWAKRFQELGQRP